MYAPFVAEIAIPANTSTPQKTTLTLPLRRLTHLRIYALAGGAKASIRIESRGRRLMPHVGANIDYLRNATDSFYYDFRYKRDPMVDMVAGDPSTVLEGPDYPIEVYALNTDTTNPAYFILQFE